VGHEIGYEIEPILERHLKAYTKTQKLQMDFTLQLSCHFFSHSMVGKEKSQ